MPTRTAKPSRDKARTTRSSLTNRTRLFIGGNAVDCRSAIARRWADHLDSFAVQLGGDPSPAQEALIRNCATIAVLLEVDQASIAAGKVIDDDRYLRRVETLRKLLVAIGLRRVAKDVSPQPTSIILDEHARAVRNDR